MLKRFRVQRFRVEAKPEPRIIAIQSKCLNRSQDQGKNQKIAIELGQRRKITLNLRTAALDYSA